MENKKRKYRGENDMKITLNENTVLFHLVAIVKIIYKNLKNFVNNGANKMQYGFDTLREKRKQRKIAKAKKLLGVEQNV